VTDSVQSTGSVSSLDTKRWMRGSSTSLRGALLALLLERPGHGYDLASRLRERLGRSWFINHTSIYPLLDDLEAEGLIVGRPEPARKGRRVLVTFHPTNLTAPALSQWMQMLASRPPMRVELHAKIAVAREQDAEWLLRALREYERECLQLLQDTPASLAMRRHWQLLAIDCARDAAQGQLRAEIEWARRTRQRIAEHIQEP
jgi:DNA-binding PadR family transcriptional regulator